MPFEIVRNDITNMHVDAIVNAASRFPRVNAGVDAAIHKKAGPELLAARKVIGNILPGTAAITPAFRLNAQYVIHAATPTWIDGLHGELKALRSAYDMCLNLAVKNDCDSIAFPLLAAGNHGYPRQKALQVAISAFSEFLMEHEMQIYLVVFGHSTYRLSEKLFHNVRSYIDENYVVDYEQEMYGGISERERRARYRNRSVIESREDFMVESCADIPCASAPCQKDALSLEDFLKGKDEGFSEKLLKLIDKTGKKDSEIYKKANLSKQHFSKIRNNPNYKPTKATALALAIALELDLAQTKDLIGRAGFALTNSSTFDLIIQYFIEHKQYNIIEINITLYEFDQSLLGA